MASEDFIKASENLKKFDKATQKAVLELYDLSSVQLNELILNDSVGLREAQNRLMKTFDDALVSTDFVSTWRTGLINTVVVSTYSANIIGMPVNTFANKLYRTSLFNDSVTLSQRIRKNANIIVSTQRAVIKTALKNGRAITETIKKINDLGEFDDALPKYLNDLKNARINGKQLSTKAFNNAKSQIAKIKTPRLQRNYKKLLDAIELDKMTDTVVSNAMVARTSYFSNRLARTETIATLAEVKNEEAMGNPNTGWVKNVLSSSSNHCPYCIAISRLGWIPVENARIAPFHPNCSCTPIYKQSSERPTKLTNDEYRSKVKKQVDIANKEAKGKDKPISYIHPQTPINLRNNNFLDNLGGVG